MLALFVGLLTRHLLTAGGGALVAGGLATADQAQAIMGGIAALAGVVWSFVQKRRAK